MAKTITLQYAAACRDCGAELQPGAKARWYGRGRVYGLDCHEQTPRERGGEPLGQTLSRYDRYGIYSGDGTRLGSHCRCEDYPCCGH
jgi:hypothetical protein